MNNNNFADSVINQVVDTNGINDLLDAHNLNWAVVKAPLMMPDGKASGFYALQREDTGLVFATCGADYHVFNNYELAELCMKLAGATGMHMASAGSFEKGADVYFQLETETELKGIGKNKDVVKGLATATNNHSTGRTLRWGHSNDTISCRNTFNRVVKQLRYRARHTATMRDKVEQAIREIDAVRKVEAEVFAGFSRMAEVEIKRKNIIEVVQAVTGVDIALGKKELEENYTTYSLDRVSELLAAIRTETEQKGESLWGLFSGVTKYTTHIMPTGRKEDGKAESKFVGNGFRFDNAAYDLLLPA